MPERRTLRNARERSLPALRKLCSGLPHAARAHGQGPLLAPSPPPDLRRPVPLPEPAPGALPFRTMSHPGLSLGGGPGRFRTCLVPDRVPAIRTSPARTPAYCRAEPCRADAPHLPRRHTESAGPPYRLPQPTAPCPGRRTESARYASRSRTEARGERTRAGRTMEQRRTDCPSQLPAPPIPAHTHLAG